MPANEAVPGATGAIHTSLMRLRLIEERSIWADGAASWAQRYPSQTQRRLQMQLCHKQLQYRC